HLAERVPESVAAACRRAAPRGQLGVVVFADRRERAHEEALRFHPVAVVRRDLGQRRDGVRVLARAVRVAAFIDPLSGKGKDGSRKEEERDERESQPASGPRPAYPVPPLPASRFPLPSHHPFLPSISRIDFDFRASCTSSSSSASSYASGVIDAFLTRNAS